MDQMPNNQFPINLEAGVQQSDQTRASRQVLGNHLSMILGIRMRDTTLHHEADISQTLHHIHQTNNIYLGFTIHLGTNTMEKTSPEPLTDSLHTDNSEDGSGVHPSVHSEA